MRSSPSQDVRITSPRRILLFTILIIALILSTVLLSACDTGKVCGSDGNCEPAAEEDRATLEPHILNEIGTGDLAEESP